MKQRAINLRLIAFRTLWLIVAALTILPVTQLRSAEASTNAPAWLSSPLSLADAMDLALQRNANIQRGKADIEASYGVILQTRAVALPRVRSTGNFTVIDPDFRDKFPFPTRQPNQTWAVNIQVIQSVYEGGRVNSAKRAGPLTRDQALAQYQAVVADTLLEVQIAYYDVLLTEQLIGVQEASITLLSKELGDTRNRFEAGTVPRFNVLRAEVELANAQPRFIRAKNAARIAKNNLATALGYDVPRNIWENIPLHLTGKLDSEPMEIQLPAALGQALERRPELSVLRKAQSLRREDIINAKAGYKPSIQIFGGYGARNSSFGNNLARELHGWSTGVLFSWDIFDGLLTRGRVRRTEALYDRSRIDLTDTSRRIEQEVRTAYSTFIEAKEVLESQKKVQEQAEEALRLATARNEAGAGTQLDVLSAQTALTEARSTQVQALRDYDVARSRLQRSIGQNIKSITAPGQPPPNK